MPSAGTCSWANGADIFGTGKAIGDLVNGAAADAMFFRCNPYFYLAVATLPSPRSLHPLGTSGIELAAGVGHYLRHVANVSFSWPVSSFSCAPHPPRCDDNPSLNRHTTAPLPIIDAVLNAVLFILN